MDNSFVEWDFKKCCDCGVSFHPRTARSERCGSRKHKYGCQYAYYLKKQKEYRQARDPEKERERGRRKYRLARLEGKLWAF